MSKRVLKVFCFLVIFICLQMLFSFMVTDTNSTTRLQFHDFYNEKQLDIAFIGASRVRSGIIPEVILSSTGYKAFNLGTSSQTLDGSYYLIKEIINKKEIKQVWLAIEFTGLSSESGKEWGTCIITDYLRGKNKYEYIFNVSDGEKRKRLLFPFLRQKNNLTFDYLYNNLRAKLNRNYFSYSNNNSIYGNYSYYLGGGYSYLYKENTGYDFMAYIRGYGEFDKVETFDSEAISYLKKSLELCKENNIEIVLFTMPESFFYLNYTGEYDSFLKFIRQLAKEYNVKYYNFNLMEEEFFPASEFANLDHFAYYGSVHFSNVLSKLIVNPEYYKFSSSLDNKKHEFIDGILYERSKESSIETIKWEIVGDSNQKLVYKIDIMNIYGTKYQSDYFETDSYSCEADDKIGQYYILSIYDKNKTFLGKACLK